MTANLSLTLEISVESPICVKRLLSRLYCKKHSPVNFIKNKRKMEDKKQIRNSTAEFLIFTNQVKDDGIEVRVQNETIWLTQKLMAELFDCSIDNISLHLKNIFKENELQENSVTEDFSITASDGKKYKAKHYNLDAIIAIGYRVNSVRATSFRQWATSILRDYAIRGYVIDRKRMENGTFLGEDYFERLLAEIREIRMSERRFYQKITDIYATSMDYNKDAAITKTFFAKIQNKLHYAVHGHTAAELIKSRADSEKTHMGLTNWEKSPDGKIVKTDVVIAKNYLTETELESLGRIVNAYLDLAEDRAKRHIPMTMEDWAKRLDKFLEADDRNILQDSGTITAQTAKDFAENEFEKFRIKQDQLFESDFDKEIKRIAKENKITKNKK
ncbi:MAG: virulence RhuM family protein [Planctomycetaceae bacterium]|nr:virulence RhuM family protein [Planctomycetaceae bacterium]